jgi:hypothetical protein
VSGTAKNGEQAADADAFGVVEHSEVEALPRVFDFTNSGFRDFDFKTGSVGFGEASMLFGE